MSTQQKSVWFGYTLMFGFLTIVLSTVVPSITKSTVNNISAIPVIMEKLDVLHKNQDKIIDAQDMCRDKAVTCLHDITVLQGYHR